MGEAVGEKAEGFGVQALFDTVEEVVRQGNVRRIVVTDRRDRTVLDVPITAGVVAAVFAPMLLAAGAALALVGGWRIQVEHTDPDVAASAAATEPAPDAEPEAEPGAAPKPDAT
jgi:hypothetical protein